MNKLPIELLTWVSGAGDFIAWRFGSGATFYRFSTQAPYRACVGFLKSSDKYLGLRGCLSRAKIANDTTGEP